MPPITRRSVLVGTAALGLSSLARGRPRDPLPRPVLLIDLDDLGEELLLRAISLGYAPNLRTAIATGRSYKDFWAAPNCSPFRARVIAGLDAYRPGNLLGVALDPQDVFAGPIGTWMPAGLPGSKVKLGKWHISSEPSFPAGLIAGGYDRFVGIKSNVGEDGAGTYYNWKEWSADANGSSAATQTQHVTTRLGQLTLAELGAGTELIHASFQAVHVPLSNPPNNEPPGKVYSGTSYEAKQLNTLFHADYWIGLILAAALVRNYVVLIACDNGTAGFGKATALESGNNTTLIVVGAGVLPGQSTRLIQATDLWATVRRLRGDTSLQAADSRDFCDDFLAVPQIDPPRQFMTLDWFPTLGVAPTPANHSRMISTVIGSTRWKYLDQKHTPSGGALAKVGLWDLLNDPGEKVNLLSGTLSGEAQAAYDLLVANLPG